ncbi:hypothetical protein FB157_13531 [Streptomyces sp. BK340]|nr:hypothetical protein FB157_13531 [Streptomyces sp. BK340]
MLLMTDGILKLCRCAEMVGAVCGPELANVSGAA